MLIKSHEHKRTNLHGHTTPTHTNEYTRAHTADTRAHAHIKERTSAHTHNRLQAHLHARIWWKFLCINTFHTRIKSNIMKVKNNVSHKIIQTTIPQMLNKTEISAIMKKPNT